MSKKCKPKKIKKNKKSHQTCETRVMRLVLFKVTPGVNLTSRGCNKTHRV